MPDDKRRRRRGARLRAFLVPVDPRIEQQPFPTGDIRPGATCEHPKSVRHAPATPEQLARVSLELGRNLIWRVIRFLGPLDGCESCLDERIEAALCALGLALGELQAIAAHKTPTGVVDAHALFEDRRLEALALHAEQHLSATGGDCKLCSFLQDYVVFSVRENASTIH